MLIVQCQNNVVTVPVDVHHVSSFVNAQCTGFPLSRPAPGGAGIEVGHPGAAQAGSVHQLAASECDSLFVRTIQRPREALNLQPIMSGDSPGRRRFVSRAVGSSAGQIVEVNDCDPISGRQQSDLIEILQDLGNQNPNVNSSAKGWMLNESLQADIGAQRWVRGSPHSPPNDSAPMEMDYGSAGRQTSRQEERPGRPPKKRHRASMSHQTISDCRQATRAREHRDGSPGDSSSSRSRSGSGDRRRRHGTSGDGRGREPTDRTESSPRDGSGRRSKRGNGDGSGPPDKSVKSEPADGPDPGGDDPDPPVTPAVAAARAASAKFVGNNLKYDGTTELETFLARFNKYANYLTWNERDKFYHRSISLHGDAAQILWDTDDENTYQGMIRLLRTRFGSVGQKERFRAELRNRRRKPGETIQHLYNDVRRLFSLSYPGQTSKFGSIVARDCFLDALGDDDFRIRILERDPLSADAALQLAVRLESIDGCRTVQPRTGTGQVPKHKEHFSRAVTRDDNQAVSVESVCPDFGSDRILRDFGNSMQGCIDKMTAFQSEVELQGRKMHEGAQRVATSPAGNAMTVGGTAHPRPPLQQRSPESKQSSIQSLPNQFPTRREPVVQLVDSTDGQKSTYLSVSWLGRQYNALLDSGCEVSVIGKGLLPKDIELSPPETDLFAANKTKIPLLG